MTLDSLAGDSVATPALEGPGLKGRLHSCLEFLDHDLGNESLGGDAVLEVVALLEVLAEEVLFLERVVAEEFVAQVGDVVQGQGVVFQHAAVLLHLVDHPEGTGDPQFIHFAEVVDHLLDAQLVQRGHGHLRHMHLDLVFHAPEGRLVGQH